jgi:hypothetical protein
MNVKIYVPKEIEIPSEYLAPLAQRASDGLGDSARGTPATRGHLVRQAIRDGLLRELDELVSADGKIDVFCDPHGEIPLEIDNHTVTLSELIATLNGKRAAVEPRASDNDISDAVGRNTIAMKRKVA